MLSLLLDELTGAFTYIVAQKVIRLKFGQKIFSERYPVFIRTEQPQRLLYTAAVYDPHYSTGPLPASMHTLTITAYAV